ncbi:MAG: helix-turn-helix transcriptional regulator [Planctomycetes bacterium]|nr:helix-turn-helix transcriptional regulator [Planctomycetota bacterium]
MRLVSHLDRAIRKKNLSHAQFAELAGLSLSTVEKLVGNKFKEIRVDTFERIATHAGIGDIRELIELQDDTADFLAPFKENCLVNFVFGTHDVLDAPEDKPPDRRAMSHRTTLDMWDFRAQTAFLDHVRSQVPQIHMQMEFFSRESFGAAEKARVLERVKKENTVIIGSPKVNPACEAVLRALYPSARRGASARRKGPPLLLAEKDRMDDSILGAPGFDEVGVAQAQTWKMIAHTRFAGPGAVSLDTGIIVAVFRPLGAKDAVSLVIAAGITGCGTCGAIQGLIEHPPRSQDLRKGQPWVKAFCTHFVKPTASPRDDRRIEKVELVEEERLGGA